MPFFVFHGTGAKGVEREEYKNTLDGCGQFIISSLDILVPAEWVELLVLCIIMLAVHKHRHTLRYTTGSFGKTKLIRIHTDRSLDTHIYIHTYT